MLCSTRYSAYVITSYSIHYTKLYERKLLIRYKQERGWPQYSAVLMDWKIDPALDDATFEARVPEDADRVEFIEVRKDGP